jgi:PAS domain S-box-containing protein
MSVSRLQPQSGTRASRLLAICLAFAATLSVAAPSGQEIGLAQLGVERWGPDAGLAGSWVRDIVEGPDGFIWIATSNGLSRFDGRSFANFSAANTPELPHSAISALANGANGRIWIGLAYGGVRVLVDGSIRREPAFDLLPEGTGVLDLLEDPSGVLWVATEQGLWKIVAGSAEQVAPTVDGREAVVHTLFLSASGDTWARTARHGIWRIVEGKAINVADAPGCVGNGVAVDSVGSIFTTCAEGIWRRDGASEVWSQLAPNPSVGRVLLDRRGGLWFGAREGLTRWSGGALDMRPLDDQLRDWRVRAFLEDSRGDVWIGTFAGGLTRLRRGPVRAFGASEQLPIQGTTAVLAGTSGDLWIGAWRQGLLQWRPGSGIQQHWTSENGLPGHTAWALATDARRPDGVWVGGDQGLAWIEAGRLQSRGPGDIAYSAPLRLIYADPLQADTLWVSGETGGAVELGPGRQIAHDRGRGLPLDRVLFFHRDRAGRLLAGGREGLFQLDQGQWSAIAPAGAPMRSLIAITEQPDGSLWLSSEVDGLIRISADGVTRYGLDQALPFWPTYSLELDQSGWLWLSGEEGLARMRLDDHERWRRGELASIPFERLARRDGLRDIECNGWGSPASTRLVDGTLVYPTNAGIALVDSTGLPAVALSANEIYVESASAGERAVSIAEPVRLADFERSLRIGFSAIELLRPEAVSFRYRMDGFDRDWIAASQVSEANYAHLAPGNFRFHLQARLPGREWVDAAHSLEVVVEPQIVESTWFRASLAALIIGLALGVFRWRLKLEKRHARVLGRARAFLRDVIDTSPNPIFARRRDGGYTLANRAAAEVYGLTPDQVEGQTPRPLGKELPGMAPVDALDAEVIASGEERVLPEIEIVDHADRRRWFRVVKRPGFAADGRTVEQVIGTAVDVTDFKLAELRLTREQGKLRRSREEARRLSRQLLRAQEDERRRLAQEMHDDLTQRLAGLAMLAWSTSQALERDSGRDVRKNVEEIAGELERVANEVGAMSRELHPPALTRLGLADALCTECTTFAKRTGMEVRFESAGTIVGPEAEVGLALYRIVQEGLRNSLAHSGARQAQVTLSGDERELRLEISDCGAGFDPAATTLKPGLGLSSMRERARLIGGEIEFDAAPGLGTRITVRVPT